MLAEATFITKMDTTFLALMIPVVVVIIGFWELVVFFLFFFLFFSCYIDQLIKTENKENYVPTGRFRDFFMIRKQALLKEGN